MPRIPAIRHIALLLVLSLSGIGAVGVPHACGGACCVAPESGAQSAHRALQATPAGHACCCGGEAAPCDLEKAPEREGIHSALSSVPRIDAPHQTPAALGCGAAGAVPAASRPLSRVEPTAQAPPGPIYLHNCSLLC